MCMCDVLHLSEETAGFVNTHDTSFGAKIETMPTTEDPHSGILYEMRHSEASMNHIISQLSPGDML